MKFAIALIAAVALVSSVQSAPVDQGPRGKIQDLINAAKVIFSGKIEELKKQRDLILQQIKNSKDDAKVELQKHLAEITAQLKKSYSDMIEAVKEILHKQVKGETYGIADDVVSKLKKLRAKAQEILKNLRKITEQESAKIADDAKRVLQEQKEKLLNRLDEITAQIQKIIIEHLGGKVYALSALGPDAKYDDKEESVLAKLKRKLAEKYQEYEKYIEMVKAAHGIASEEVKAAIQRLKTELRQLREDVVAELRKIIHGQ